MTDPSLSVVWVAEAVTLTALMRAAAAVKDRSRAKEWYRAWDESTVESCAGRDRTAGRVVSCGIGSQLGERGYGLASCERRCIQMDFAFEVLCDAAHPWFLADIATWLYVNNWKCLYNWIGPISVAHKEFCHKLLSRKGSLQAIPWQANVVSQVPPLPFESLRTRCARSVQGWWSTAFHFHLYFIVPPPKRCLETAPHVSGNGRKEARNGTREGVSRSQERCVTHGRHI